MAQLTKNEYIEQTDLLFPTNGVGAITAAKIREHFGNTADSFTVKANGKTTAPTQNDDSINSAGNGAFGVGDIWIDETNNVIYICLDNTIESAIWTAVASTGGDVNIGGIPANSQLSIWTGSNTIAGDNNLVWTGTELTVTGNINVADLIVTGNIDVTGTVDGRDLSADGAILDSLSTVATTGVYADLSGLPTLGTAAAANVGDFASASQGAKADTAAQLTLAQSFTAAQGVTPVALTDAATIATNASLSNVFTVTLGGNRNIGNPTNIVAGRTYAWIVTQDGVGGRSLAFESYFDFPGGTAPLISAGPNNVDLIVGIAVSSTRLLCVASLDFM